MHTLPFFLAAAEKMSIGKTFLAAIPHVLGMFVVMATLTVLWGLCELMAYLIKTYVPVKEEVVAPRAAPAASPAPAVQAAATSGLSPETIAVIAAAVNTFAGSDYKVVAIKPQDSNWEKAGRQSVLSSHKLR
jgi:Na+-transporting methylmalonyl-CoA/oxaloacetate decarboxylase gamma subunit